jgi:glycosyltransferase involved in cell wall biosynthesis
MNITLIQKPLVSVIIPTYSRSLFLTRAVESVLNQTWSNIEIIVVDDNGENTQFQKETESVLTKYFHLSNFYYLKHSINKNGSAARNTGIKFCKGEYVTFLDDDDELFLDKIEKQIEVLSKKNDSFGGVYSGVQIRFGDKVLKKITPNLEGDLQLQLLKLEWSFGTGSNPLFRKDVFESIGLFDESFIRHQDWEYMLRFFRKYKICRSSAITINRFTDSKLNTLNAHSYEAVKLKFLSTFENDILKYDNQDVKVIYRNHLADVGFHAFQDKEYKLGWKYYKLANSYKLLSFKIIGKVLYYTSTNSNLR